MVVTQGLLGHHGPDDIPPTPQLDPRRPLTLANLVLPLLLLSGLYYAILALDTDRTLRSPRPHERAHDFPNVLHYPNDSSSSTPRSYNDPIRLSTNDSTSHVTDSRYAMEQRLTTPTSNENGLCIGCYHASTTGFNASAGSTERLNDRQWARRKGGSRWGDLEGRHGAPCLREPEPADCGLSGLAENPG